jgi:SAM-dependent methyltransferase
MTNNEILDYYDVTADRDVRSDLQQAIKLVDEPGIAIDCGCGAGRDIAYLLANGYIVHAFDIESDSILRCKKRFEGKDNVFLSQDSFNSFSYPLASLILADASLFFCPEGEFDEVWSKIYKSLSPGGIFVGSFLGPNDTMVDPGYRKELFWPDVLVFEEVQLRPMFNRFEIMSWTEHNIDGKTAQGKLHHWHIFSIIAKKI